MPETTRERDAEPTGARADVEPNAVRDTAAERLDAAMYATLPVLALAVVLLLVLATAADYLDYPAARRTFVPLGVGNVLISVGILWAVKSRRAGPAASAFLISLLGLAAAFNSLVSLAISRDLTVWTHLCVEILGISTVLLSVRWMVGSALAISAGAAFVMFKLGPRASLGQYAISLAASGVLATIAVASRRAVLLRLYAARDAQTRAAHEAERARCDAERELASRIDAERERETYREQFIRAQKMEAIGQLAGGVAHDVNNSLSAIMSLAQIIRDDARDPDVRADAAEIVSAAERSASLTADLLGFSRRGTARNQPARLDRIVASVQRLLARGARKGVRISVRHPTRPAVVSCDPELISHALMNLCINAVDASQAGGTVTIETANETFDADAARSLRLDPGAYARLTVADDGVGMDETTRLRAFEPFFTTKEPGSGTGLGLSMVWSAVASHGGAIDLDSAPGRGTRLSIYLPAFDSTALDSQRPPVDPIALAARETITLLVDDDEIVRRALRRMLERIGQRVIDEPSGRRALNRVRSSAQIDLVILDLTLGDESGLDCLRAIREERPDVPVLMLTGYATEADTARLKTAGAAAVLLKPVTREALRDACSGAIASRSTSRNGVA